MKPRISVLLPVRDAKTTLAVALESLARQPLEAWECIVVDDGSRDGSRAIAEDRARHDSRLRVVTGPRQGLVAALNAGVEHCGARVIDVNALAADRSTDPIVVSVAGRRPRGEIRAALDRMGRAEGQDYVFAV